MSIADMMKMEYHYVKMYYDTLVRINKEQEKRMKEEQENESSNSNAGEFMGMVPSASSMKSMMNNLSGSFKAPTIHF